MSLLSTLLSATAFFSGRAHTPKRDRVFYLLTVEQHKKYVQFIDQRYNELLFRKGHLKLFLIQGFTIYAINKKNAERKFQKMISKEFAI